MARRYEDDPPFLPGEGPSSSERENSGIVQRVLEDPRAMLCVPMLSHLMLTMPAVGVVERANLAWDQIDALLSVRKERRAQYIQGLKDNNQFHNRSEA
jgi:hypothetical protein